MDNGIDAGTRTDIDGQTRPQGDGFDIGAYELAIASPSPTPLPTDTPAPTPIASPEPKPTATPTPVIGDGLTIYLPLVNK